MCEKDRRETVALVLDLRHSVDCTCKLLQINRPIAKVPLSGYEVIREPVLNLMLSCSHSCI